MAAFRLVRDVILEAVFPEHCIVCGRRGSAVCQRCMSGTFPSPKTRMVLNRPVHCAYPYAQPVMMKSLRALKYAGIRAAEGPIRKLVLRWAMSSGYLLPEDGVLIPVPLHRSKMRERGFNQAEIIAGALAEMVDLPIRDDVLIRSVHRGSQTSSADRMMNVSGAFRARPNRLKCLIVDDVLTSGSTMSECARAIEASGGEFLGGFALTWGDRKPKTRP